jgi:hypothetical protein
VFTSTLRSNIRLDFWVVSPFATVFPSNIPFLPFNVLVIAQFYSFSISSLSLTFTNSREYSIFRCALSLRNLHSDTKQQESLPQISYLPVIYFSCFPEQSGCLFQSRRRDASADPSERTSDCHRQPVLRWVHSVGRCVDTPHGPHRNRFPLATGYSLWLLYAKYPVRSSRVSSVGIATCYRLDGRGSVPGRSKRLSLLHRVQTGSGAHPTSYPMGTKGIFSGDKDVGAWSWLLISVITEVKNCGAIPPIPHMSLWHYA